MKKYIAVIAGVTTQACLGGVYAWSAFVPSLREHFGYSSAQTQLVFGSTIGLLTTFMIITGRLHDRIGPRPLGIISGVFLTAQYLCASWFGDRFPTLWLSMSGLGAVAISCGYIGPIATGVKWFPKHKGMISGLAVAGYGGGAILLSTIAQALFSRGWDVLSVFRVVGLVYGPITVAMGFLLFTPPSAGPASAESFPWRKLFRCRCYRRLAVGIFCGTLPGLVIIGNLKPIALDYRVAAAAATAAIAALAVGNATGRISWGHIQDRLGARGATLLCLSASAVSVCIFLLLRGNSTMFLAASVFLGFCYGGSLSLYAAQAAEAYGTHRVGSTYPWVLFVHGVAAVVGPPLGGWIYDISGSYRIGIALCILVSLAGIFGYERLSRGSDVRVFEHDTDDLVHSSSDI